MPLAGPTAYDLCMHFTLAMKTGRQAESCEIIVVGAKIGPNTKK